MGIFDLVVIAIGLSMDAFAVSICKGLSVKKVQPKHVITAGAYFGGFQALMPLIGYMLGKQFESMITSIDHWIAFVLLGIIGGNMVREALSGDDDVQNDSFSFKTMFPLAIATSIDALAIGVTFAFLKVNIIPAVLLIGVITFGFSAVGIKIGNAFGTKYKSKAELAGGLILILLGIKILIEHLMA
ncbi:MAG: manganese efflux pump MntP family protein [Acutalibacteraceae bacterium]|nr:manganese efflux pump MntP family protein [Bacillota bacterium]